MKLKCRASRTLQSNTVSLPLSLKQIMTRIQRLLLFSSWNQLPGFSLKPNGWWREERWRLVTLYFFSFFFIIIVLFFTFLSAPSDGFRSKASISLLLSFFSAMFWLHKSIYDDLSRRRKERRTFSPRKTDRVLAFRIMVTQLEGISEKQTGTRGGKVSSALLRRLRLSFIQPVLRSKKLKKC